jgi:hypothetical protein
METMTPTGGTGVPIGLITACLDAARAAAERHGRQFVLPSEDAIAYVWECSTMAAEAAALGLEETLRPVFRQCVLGFWIEQLTNLEVERG